MDSKEKRKLRIRKKIWGTIERPRVTVYRSNKYFYGQAIDDTGNVTVQAVKSSINPKVEDIKNLGQKLGEVLSKKGITQVVFDRNGYAYHGKVSAFAEGLRSANIKV